MSVEKVKLPREVAEAIEFAKSKEIGLDNLGITKMSEDKESRYVSPLHELYMFKEECPDTLMQALVNGYEVEQTPEDKLRNYYEKCSEKVSELLDCGSIDFAEVERWKGEREGIRNTLAILGFKIEGVSA